MRKLIVSTLVGIFGALTPAGLAAAETIIVERGDTVSEHAEDHGVSWQEMGECSGLANPHLIFPGDELIVPGTEECRDDPGTSSPTTSPEPAAAPEPAPEPEPVQQSSSSSSSSVWDAVAECESNGNWSINTGNGYYGGLQFSLQSWRAVGGSGYPHNASRSEQIARAERLKDIQGWGAWPACSSKLGLR